MKIVTYLVAAVLWTLDTTISLMRFTRLDERTTMPTQRVSWREGLKRELARKQTNICVYCGYRRKTVHLEIDHITPVVRGGSNDEANLQLACGPCNRRKGLMTDEEFRHRYSRLVPRQVRTAPRRPVMQSEFRTETARTRQPATARRFRSSRRISNMRKVAEGSMAVGIITSIVIGAALFQWTSLGALQIFAGASMPGCALGIGLYARAKATGMTDD